MSGAPRRSLASAFQGKPNNPSRSEALQGLLPPRPSQDSADSSPVTLSVVAGDIAASQDDPEPGDASRQGTPQHAGPAAASAADVVRGVAVYLPLEILERLRRTARSREMTYAELLVEAAAAHLTEIAAVFDVGAAVSAGSGMPSRASKRHSQPGVQVQLRLDGHQVAWLDAQADQLGAPSRSSLVVALFREHLNGGPAGVSGD